MTAIKNIMNQLYFHSIYYIRMLRKEDFMNYHIVRAGDTFYKLSQMYNVSLETIIRANPEIDPKVLRKNTLRILIKILIQIIQL